VPALSATTARVVTAVVLLAALVPFAFLDRYPSVYEDEVFYNYPALQAEYGLRPWQIESSAPHWRDLWGYDLTLLHYVQRAAIRTFGLSLATMRSTSLVPSVLAVAGLCALLIECGAPALGVLLAVLWVGDRSYPEAFFSRPEGIALLGLALSYLAALRFKQRGTLVYAAMAGAASAAAVTAHPAMVLAMLTLIAACVLFAARTRRLHTLLACAAGASIPVLLLGISLWPNWKEALEQFRWHVQYVRQSTPTLTRLYWFNWTLGWARAWSWLTLAIIPVVFALAVRRCRAARSGVTRFPHAIEAALAASVALALLIARPPYQWNPYQLILTMPFELLAILLMMHDTPPARTLTRIAIALVAATWIPSAAQNALRVRGGAYAYALTDPAIMRRDLARYIPHGARASVEPALVIPSVQVGLDIDVLPWFGEPGRLPDDRWLILRRYSVRPELEGRTVYHLNQYLPGSKWFSAPYTIVAPAATADRTR
jgi:hypothetical protein